MRILLATEVIYPGGAETFVLRLAKAYQEQGHEVKVFTFYKEYYHKEVHESLAPEVPVVWPKIPFNRIFSKIDGLFFRLSIDYKFRNDILENGLKKTLEEFKPDVIHSNLLKVDRISLRAAKDLNIPVITTVHGDYLQFHAKLKEKKPISILNYEQKARTTLSELDKVVCISDRQIAFLKEHFGNAVNGKMAKIYNGYTGIKPVKPALEMRKSIGIGEHDFVFGLVSRGIMEKGWQESINALQKLNRPDVHLVFVGKSDYLNELKEKYSAEKNIHFIGQSFEPLEWINIFDAGLLPSTYGSESLPTVVIEYLFCNKPVIGSDVGEIKNMLNADGKEAGIIVSAAGNKISVDELTEAMRQYVDNKELYNKHLKNTEDCFAQFDMTQCTIKYMNVYNDVIRQKKK